MAARRRPAMDETYGKQNCHLIVFFQISKIIILDIQNSLTLILDIRNSYFGYPK